MNNCVLSGTGQTISELCREEQIGVVTKLFQKYALLYYERVYPSILSLEAMVQLDRGGGTNVMYNLVKAIGTKRPNSMRNGMTPICRIFIIPPTTTASMRVTYLILTFHPHNHLYRKMSRVPRAESMATSTFSSGKSSLPSHKTLHTRAIFHNPPEERAAATT